ncbi:PEP-CTERM sorting domain-containing protein [Nostoc sp. CENA67]|uniref:PEP-CTERM sorting domain-containing protein n=1 Tax=Amazonocrinis nigriterrae CENA67 TaxID=2794033 RepID=A0A8J7HKQ2_9NOST|nr:PEP-CTERM sorting domain-containing protein [Amazonocrinis nigriterrae]MBH8561382.1 PEP-CTERM sorting domain-containing protein [Amazonocrinis nigriterrae CENA67]
MKFCTLSKNSIFQISLVSFGSFCGLAMTPSAADAALLDLGSWQQFGDVTTTALGEAKLSNNALQDEDFLADTNFNYSGNAAGSARPFPDLQDFLGLQPEALDVEGEAVEGSAIKNTVTVAAGDVLRFDWNFRTNETQNKDFAFLLVDNTLIKLADFTNATQADSPFGQKTGLRSYTFSNAGTYTFAFGVVDVDGFDTTSALEVTNARIETVPEPTTVLGLGMLLALGATKRRFLVKNSPQRRV